MIRLSLRAMSNRQSTDSQLKTELLLSAIIQALSEQTDKANKNQLTELIKIKRKSDTYSVVGKIDY